MIILQILAALCLIPFTCLLPITFYVYCMHWGYVLIAFSFLFSYAALCAILLQAPVTLPTFLVLIYLWAVRMIYLARAVPRKNYRLLEGTIKSSRNAFSSLFIVIPLSFIRILKILPIKTDLPINKFVDLILTQSIGTKFEIQADEVDICFEIK